MYGPRSTYVEVILERTTGVLDFIDCGEIGLFMNRVGESISVPDRWIEITDEHLHD